MAGVLEGSAVFDGSQSASAPAASSGANQGGGFWDSTVGNVLKRVWSGVNTAIGVTYGLLGYGISKAVYGLSFGRIDLGASISVSGGAIHFENNPIQRVFGGAITLGDAINYSGSANLYRAHELAHVPQGWALGPLYIPANIIGMTASLGHFALRGFSYSGWISPIHGPGNFMETGPLSSPPRSTPWK